MRVDHHLSNDEYDTVMKIWSRTDKVIPFTPPQPCEGATGVVEDVRGRIVSLEKQGNEMTTEMLEDLKQTQLDMMERQRDMNKQLMEGLVRNLGQMLQAKHLCGQA